MFDFYTVTTQNCTLIDLLVRISCFFFSLHGIKVNSKDFILFEGHSSLKDRR